MSGIIAQAGMFGRRGLPNVTDGLIAWWKLDDGSGSTAKDSAGDNDGTLVGPPDWVEGKINGALDFDGESDHVTADNISLNSDFTITGWTYLDSAPGVPTRYNLMLEMASGLGDFSRLISCASVSGGDAIRTVVRVGGTNADFTVSGSSVLGVWVFWALMRESDTCSLWKNANEIGSATLTGSDGPVSGVRIGQTWDGTVVFTNGKKDDIRVYDRALTAAEIETLYNWRE